MKKTIFPSFLIHYSWWKTVCTLIKLIIRLHVYRLQPLTAHSLISSSQPVRDDSTWRKWSHNSVDICTFKLALIHVTINVCKKIHSRLYIYIYCTVWIIQQSKCGVCRLINLGTWDTPEREVGPADLRVFLGEVMVSSSTHLMWFSVTPSVAVPCRRIIISKLVPHNTIRNWQRY